MKRRFIFDFRYQSHNRGQRGLSLPSVLALSTILAVASTAMMTTVVPVYREAARLKHGNTVRALAEQGAEEVLFHLNSDDPEDKAKYDPGDGKGAYRVVDVTASVSSDPKAKVVASIDSLPKPPSSSMLYDQTLPGQNPYRMLTISASYGGTITQLRTLLKPAFNGEATEGAAGFFRFPYAAFGLNRVVFVGKSGSNSYNTRDPRLYAELGTLGKISQVHSSSGGLARGIAQGGSHFESPNPQSEYNKQFDIVGDEFNAKPVSYADWMQMMGNKYSNGVNTAYHGRHGEYAPNQVGSGGISAHQANPGPSYNSHPYPSEQNVFGLANGVLDGVPSPLGSNDAGGQYIPKAPTFSDGQSQWTGTKSTATQFNPIPGNVEGGVTYPQPEIPPVPDPPPGKTFDLGTIKLTNSTLRIDPAAPARTSGIGSVSNKTISIPPGDYTFNTLTLSNSKIEVVTPSGGTVPPTTFYQKAGGNGTVVSVDNKSSVNMTGISKDGSGNPHTGFNTEGYNGIPKHVKAGQNPEPTNRLAINPPTPSTHPTTPTPPGFNASKSAQHPPITETGGSSNNLRIYSETTGTMDLQGNQRMVLYAPNAEVNIGSQSELTKDANFYGGLVAKIINIMSHYTDGGGAYLHYDGKLAGEGGAQFWDPFAPPALLGAPVDPTAAKTPIGYRAISWQEAAQPNAALAKTVTHEQFQAIKWRYEDNK